ncbi:hypothetical protein PBI_ANDREW_64 [Arthrobacter phage Andrew]|uniref:Uncharacterized protein n=1 Tax=Arthrobacter phage Andrew TaxID=2419946 RepID=A0A3G2KD22_9CAUD|nr:hypothetical protein HOU53_gp64 [Arthrobacter phage Andrew]AYN56887.1 hypothetical protein PBI_ANDREW_64 [Arthrobacter phage Andrew]
MRRRTCARYVNTPIVRRGRVRSAARSAGTWTASTGAKRSATVEGGRSSREVVRAV